MPMFSFCLVILVPVQSVALFYPFVFADCFTHHAETHELTSGALSLKLDDRPTKSALVRDGTVIFAISAGEHHVVEVWK
jgi:hypothetical protein